MFTRGHTKRCHLLKYFGSKQVSEDSVDDYGSQPKTLNLTPPELMRTPGYVFYSACFSCLTRSVISVTAWTNLSGSAEDTQDIEKRSSS